MDLLPFFRVTCELSASEFVRRLTRDSTRAQVRDFRLALFREAVANGLADEGDVPVARRKINIGGWKSVKDKHAEDAWTLVSCMCRVDHIPRDLLRNGKRSIQVLTESQRVVREGSTADCS